MSALRVNNFAAIVAAIILLAASAFAAEPKISASVEIDKSSITVGDIVTLKISAAYPENTTAEIPNLTGKLGEFFIRDMKFPKPERSADGETVLQAIYVITTYFNGDIVVPPIPITFTYKDAAGEKKQTITTDAIAIRVNKVSPDNATDVKDIKPPLEIPVNKKLYVLIGLVVLIAAILIVGAIYYFTGKKETQALAEKLVLPGPPHEVALQELARIEAMGLVESGDFPVYYDLVTDTLRKYLGARYSFNAIDMTTDEILDSMNTRIRRLEIRDSIASLLRDSDMVKFAKSTSDKDRAGNLMTQTRRLVDETTPASYHDASAGRE